MVASDPLAQLDAQRATPVIYQYGAIETVVRGRHRRMGLKIPHQGSGEFMQDYGIIFKII